MALDKDLFLFDGDCRFCARSVAWLSARTDGSVTFTPWQRVDIDALVATVDLEPVIDRLPIVEIAEYVIEQTDLPAIIRQSTGGVASDAIDAVRLRSYATDIATARIVDRLLPRRGRKLDAPGEPESLSESEPASKGTS